MPRTIASPIAASAAAEHDDEDREHLAVDRGAAVAREGDVVDVGGVQDQLDAIRMPIAFLRVSTV